jgi:ATP-dependent RNA helicase RhlB
MPRALVLAPTRELALQIFKDAQHLGKYCHFRNLVIFGGMDYHKQQEQLRRVSPDLIVATPGRLLDFRGSGLLNLGRVEVLVLDEADRMLDMGFIPDVKRIIYSLPPKDRRQTMLFSATLNQDILNLAARWLKNPVMIEVEPEQVTLKTTDQRVYAVAARDKFALLFNLIQREAPTRMLVFRNRRDGVDRLARKLALAGVPCAALSGDVPQDKRIRILEDFRAGKTRVVVATDVAGRGIHVEGISHVVNYDIPEDAEDYVHRIGRTGRAGATGIAVTFACEEGAFNMPAIEKYIGRSLACIQPDEGWLKVPEAVAHKIAADAARPPFRRPAFRPHSRGRGRR